MLVAGEICFKIQTHAFRCPNSKSGLIGKEICDGFPSCNDTAPHLSADEFNCSRR